jgi:hypothetical protein
LPDPLDSTAATGLDYQSPLKPGFASNRYKTGARLMTWWVRGGWRTYAMEPWNNRSTDGDNP